jgi:hypothetical protein
MPASVKGGIELRKALREFTPELAKETQKELGAILKPITSKARGFIPSTAPLSGWADSNQKGAWSNRVWSSSEAKRGIGYKTTPSKVNRSGFRSLVRIQNASVSGAIYETAGRKSGLDGRPQAKMREVVIPTRRLDTGVGEERYMTSTGKAYGKSNNPNAGKQFIAALGGEITNAYVRKEGAVGRASQKMKGRAIFRAFAEDKGQATAAVIKAIERSKDSFEKIVSKGSGSGISVGSR